MAVALPLLLLVVMGVVDFGFLFQRYVVLTNAAMEGARVGCAGYSLGDAQSRATAYGQPGGVPGSVTDASDRSLPGAGGDVVAGAERGGHARVSYQFIGPISGLFGGSFSSVTLTAHSTVRRQLGS